MNNKTININGQLIDFQKPLVMGILNITPDSFYTYSRSYTVEDIVKRVKQIQSEGGDIIDVGAYSTRPGNEEVSVEEETKRLREGLKILRRILPNALVSVDTCRADLARMCVEEFGVGIINDVSGGEYDKDMFATIARLQVPYVLTHIKGSPFNMVKNPRYANVTRDVLNHLSERVNRLHDAGVNDIIIDPGFGFGKTVDQNYELMANLQKFEVFEMPIMVGISRKSMIYKLLRTEPEKALTGTVALNTTALLKGANILRVHDVKEATEVVKIVEAMRPYAAQEKI